MLTLDLINTLMPEKEEPAKRNELSAMKLLAGALDNLTKFLKPHNSWMAFSTCAAAACICKSFELVI